MSRSSGASECSDDSQDDEDAGDVETRRIAAVIERWAIKVDFEVTAPTFGELGPFLPFPLLSSAPSHLL